MRPPFGPLEGILTKKGLYVDMYGACRIGGGGGVWDDWLKTHTEIVLGARSGAMNVYLCDDLVVVVAVVVVGGGGVVVVHDDYQPLYTMMMRMMVNTRKEHGFLLNWDAFSFPSTTTTTTTTTRTEILERQVSTVINGYIRMIIIDWW